MGRMSLQVRDEIRAGTVSHRILSTHIGTTCRSLEECVYYVAFGLKLKSKRFFGNLRTHAMTEVFLRQEEEIISGPFESSGSLEARLHPQGTTPQP